MTTIRTASIRLARRVALTVAGPGRVLVIPSADSGSVGDQAMLDATVTALARDHGCSVAVKHIFTIPARIPLRAPCSYLDATGLAAHFRLGARLGSLREQAVVTLGADVIDGVYGAGGELNRLGILARKAALGEKTVVIGCSISATPAPAVIDRLRAMPELVVNLRDEISLARYARAVGRPGRLVADVAFLLSPEITTDPARGAEQWIRTQRAAGRKVLAVNASGHTLEKMDRQGVPAHVAALGCWLGRGDDRAVLLVPHDFRPSPVGDVEAVNAIAEGLADTFAERVHLLRAPFNAWDLKALMGQVDAVLTGRMHLAIAAFGMGTPALCVVYQGKYEGLLRHFRLDGLLMEPGDVPETETVAARIEALVAAAPDLRARIEGRLPEVTSLARRNFDWLGKKATA